jgi:hypothetical protein
MKIVADRSFWKAALRILPRFRPDDLPQVTKGLGGTFQPLGKL